MRSQHRIRMSRTLGLLTAGTLVALMLTADVTSAQEPDKSAVRYNRDSKKTKAKSDMSANLPPNPRATRKSAQRD